MSPLFVAPPTTVGTFLVAGALCLGVGYGFAAHPRRMVVWRHPLVAGGTDGVDGTTAAIYQAAGFFLAVFGAVLWTLLLLAATRLPAGGTAAAGVAVLAGGLAGARADSRRRQRGGVAAVVAGLGVLAGSAVVVLAG